MPDHDLTVSVVVYRSTPAQLQPLAQSLRCIPAAAVCFVDNAADPVLEDWARSEGFHYLCPPSNLGYGAGHNLGRQALAERNAAYHLVVNPDVEFSSQALSELIAYLDTSPEVGLVMPDVRYPDDSRQHLCKLLPSPFDLIVRRFWPNGKLKKAMEARYELRGWDHACIANVPSLSGCFMLFRTSAFTAAGGFDPHFFMYLEDVDLCRRIGQGWRTIYYPKARIIHHYAKGSYRSPKLLGYHMISAVRYFNKWGWLSDRERKQRNAACLDALGLSD